MTEGSLEWAIQQMRQGKKVRRTPGNVTYFLDSEKEKLMGDVKTMPRPVKDLVFSSKDVFASDWKVVK